MFYRLVVVYPAIFGEMLKCGYWLFGIIDHIAIITACVFIVRACRKYLSQ